MIPEAAVEAVYALLPDDALRHVNKARVKVMLEAAAPHMLAPIVKLANEWHEQGEDLMAESKTFQDEHISVELLKEGAAMVENARHIRNAIAGTK